MKFTSNLRKACLFAGLATIVALSRLLPHVPNFTASLAAIIFSAIALKSWKSFAGILIVYLASDLIINNILYTHNNFIWFTSGVYWILLPFVIVFIFNKVIYKNNFNPYSMVLSSLFSSLIFFLLSNFGEWIGSKVLYSHDLAGLKQCFINAIPFFGYELAGTLFYSSVLFGVFWLYFYPNRNYAFAK